MKAFFVFGASLTGLLVSAAVASAQPKPVLQDASEAVSQAATRTATQAAVQAAVETAIANLPQNLPVNWYAVLPDCPCNAAAAEVSPTWEQGPEACAAFFHPGAALGFRSAQTYESLPGTAHGQQCCYDAKGQLINQGPGAGTPDVWSPVSHVLEHQVEDVLPWLNLGWQVYNLAWVPNQGQACSQNDGNAGATVAVPQTPGNVSSSLSQEETQRQQLHQTHP